MAKAKQLKFFTSSKPSFFRLDENIRKLSIDRSTVWGLRLILTGWLILIVLIVVYFRHLPSKIPLFYSRPWGPDQLADRRYLFILMGILSFFTLINLWLAAKNRTNNLLLAKLAIWSTVTLYLMAVLDVVKIFTILSVW